MKCGPCCYKGKWYILLCCMKFRKRTYIAVKYGSMVLLALVR